MSSQALKQAIEPVSWNRSRGPSLSDIVDEPHSAEADGREPAAVAVGDVVHFESFARERLCRRRPAACDRPRCGEHAVQRGRARALGRRQQPVARAHREPVGFAHRGAAHDARVEEEGVNEALDQLQLLEVLLAEVRALGRA